MREPLTQRHKVMGETLRFADFLLTDTYVTLQIPPCVIDGYPDQSSGLGAHRHAERAAPDQDLSGETLLAERRHAGEDAPLQPAVGAAW